ncbi:MAG: hypothetical protein GX449_05985, partial [Synergistaceae bacterium]|nr:hypothetical protein [Synergistaceae bacterium]
MVKVKRKCWLMLVLSGISLVCLPNRAGAATTSGSLTADEIWSGVVDITGNVTIPSGFSLIIEPGTVIRFSDGTGLHVYGRLDVAGTSESPVTFTSSSTDPAKGVWSGVYFYDSSLDQSMV